MDKRILAVLLLLMFFAGPAFAGDIKANSLSYEPAPVSPGSAFTVWVQVKNDSVHGAENCLVEIKPEFPFSLQAGEEARVDLGSMEPFETRVVEYRMLVDPKAVDGQQSLKVLVGEGFLAREDSFTISVLSRTPKLEIVESSVNQLSPGTVQPVTLSIKNIGGSIARDIVLKVNPERTVTSTGVVVEREIVSLGAASNYIDHLDQDEQANMQLLLAVNQDAELKNYSVPITLEYFDVNGTPKTDTEYLGIRVSAEAEVDAVVNSVEPLAFPGGTSEIVVDMFNIGLADAKYVVVGLSGAYASVEEPRQFIGTLEADDFDSFKTKVSFDPTTPLGDLPITLKIFYKDEELEERVTTKNLVVKVASPGEAAGGVNPLLGLVGLIGLALQLIGLYVVAKWAYPRSRVLIAKFRKK